MISYPRVEHIDVDTAVTKRFNKKKSFKGEGFGPISWLAFDFVSDVVGVRHILLIQVFGSDD